MNGLQTFRVPKPSKFPQIQKLVLRSDNLAPFRFECAKILMKIVQGSERVIEIRSKVYLAIQEHRRVEAMQSDLIEIEFHVLDGFLYVLLNLVDYFLLLWDYGLSLLPRKFIILTVAFIEVWSVETILQVVDYLAALIGPVRKNWGALDLSFAGLGLLLNCLHDTQWLLSYGVLNFLLSWFNLLDQLPKLVIELIKQLSLLHYTLHF